MLGEPRVNVLKLNLALDAAAPRAVKAAPAASAVSVAPAASVAAAAFCRSLCLCALSRTGKPRFLVALGPTPWVTR